MISVTGFISLLPNFEKGKKKIGVLTTELKVKELLQVYKIDDTVNRDIQHNRILKLNKYIDQIDSNLGIYIPAIILAYEGTDPIHEGNMFLFEKYKNFVVLDGQHRIKAMEYFLENEENEIRKNKILESMVTVQIYFNLSDDQKRQLFIDINGKSRRVSRNLSVKYDDRDPINSLINDLIEKQRNRALLKMGVEREKSRIVRPSNTNWISSIRLSNFVSYLLLGTIQASFSTERIIRQQYAEIYSFLQQYFTFLESKLPREPGNVNKNLLGHEALQNTIAVVSHRNIIKLKKGKLFVNDNWREYIEMFEFIDWKPDSSLFSEHLVTLGGKKNYIGFSDNKHNDLVPLLERELRVLIE